MIKTASCHIVVVLCFVLLALLLGITTHTLGYALLFVCCTLLGVVITVLVLFIALGGEEK